MTRRPTPAGTYAQVPTPDAAPTELERRRRRLARAMFESLPYEHRLGARLYGGGTWSGVSTRFTGRRASLAQLDGDTYDSRVHDS